jgi:salicylate hydroxylase
VDVLSSDLSTSVRRRQAAQTPPSLCTLIADHHSLPDDVTDLDGHTLQKLAVDMVRDWDPTLRRMFAECDPATVVGLRFRQSTPVDPWPSTTVTVLGDAIHNMTPVGGLGANSALRRRSTRRATPRRP